MVNRELKLLRCSHDLSQADMADILGITTSSYNRKENGKQPFLLNEAIKISSIFNKSVEEIFSKDFNENNYRD